MADRDPLLIPPEALTNVRAWNPDALVDRGPQAERRAANQPGGGSRSPHQALDDARNAEAALKRQIIAARERGQREGFQAGYGEGKALVEAHVAQLQQLAANMQAAMAQVEETLASDVLALALDVARQVIRTEVASRPEPILALVQESLRLVPEGTANGEILLNAADVELVRERVADEIRLGSWRVVADPSIERGGCRIVTRQCDVDGTLVARWRRLAQTLGRDDKWNTEAPR